jgi:hypothetical protein
MASKIQLIFFCQSTIDSQELLMVQFFVAIVCDSIGLGTVSFFDVECIEFLKRNLKTAESTTDTQAFKKPNISS